MMTLPEARDYVALTTPNNSPQDRYVYSPHVDVYASASEEAKERLATAMETLIRDGADWEREMAAGFFRGLSKDRLHELMQTLICFGVYFGRTHNAT